MNDFHLAINDAVGSSTIGACLKLSGFESAADFQSFNEDTVRDIEKFVSNVCCTLPRKERSRYIDPIFIDRPDLFTFAPVVKSRLVAFIQRMISLGQLIDLSEIPIGVNEDRFDVDGYYRSNETTNKQEIVIEEIQSDCSIDEMVDYRDNLISPSQSINDIDDHRICDRDKHDYVSDCLARKFDQCQLTMDKHFRLYEMIDGGRTGFFMCRISSTSLRHKTLLPISFTMRGNPNLSKVHNHMRMHFRLSENKSTETTSENQLTNYEHKIPSRKGKVFIE